MQADQCHVVYSAWISVHEIVCLENMWRQSIGDVMRNTVQTLLVDRLPSDIVEVIAVECMPHVTTAVEKVLWVNSHCIGYVLSTKKRIP